MRHHSSHAPTQRAIRRRNTPPPAVRAESPPPIKTAPLKRDRLTLMVRNERASLNKAAVFRANEGHTACVNAREYTRIPPRR
eukprot:CAMPEP_0181325974 /NCGR_PEP_ID=MMETSP1101-20121128/21231_1 /TAXON_ID=46948 /ORGANISM="Rhodomonas abbreviata, Strain Caron Lab Isolate" /LENGTH=81 /DNA_ID=CAMNT_0023434357 /DNA_START=183 /DNA_END=425 /DNA_ORIENTATION=+